MPHCVEFLKIIMATKNKNIFLIGPMGAGKTTIGKRLAQALGLTFHDSDQIIEERAGADLSWLFDVEGEDGLQRREELVIAELCSLDGIVLSTGGGTILSEKNRDCLKRHGVIIYLQTSLEQQVARTSRNPRRRPILQDVHIPTAVIELNKQRIPLYEELADFSFRTDSSSPQVVVDRIINYLNKNNFLSTPLT